MFEYNNSNICKENKIIILDNPKDICFVEKQIINYFEIIKSLYNKYIIDNYNKGFNKICNIHNITQTIIEKVCKIESLALVLYPEYDRCEIDNDVFDAYLKYNTNVQFVYILYFKDNIIARRTIFIK